MLKELKALQVDRLDIDEAVAMSMFAEGMVSTYERNELEPPTWLTDSLSALRTEIKRRTRDELEREKKRAEQELEALMTTTERRERVKAKLARLNAKLGI